MGFTMDPERARDLIAGDARYRNVLFPYLNGKDFNSRPDCSASRWIINFHDWDESLAQRFPEAYEQVLQRVKPERLEVKFSKGAREKWWQYERRRPELYEAISGKGRILVIGQVSKAMMPAFVASGSVLDQQLVVFATDDPAMLSICSSVVHREWALLRGGNRETRPLYTPTNVFETFPLPDISAPVRSLGERLDKFRRDLMIGRSVGLTATYNLVHDPSLQDADIAELRAIHQAIDEEVVRSYGWRDLLERPSGLAHGFHDTRQGLRYTVSPAVRQEILERLLEDNQRRYKSEVANGLHEKRGIVKKKATAPSQKKSTGPAEEPPGLF
jgi:hypothetical protein